MTQEEIKTYLSKYKSLKGKLEVIDKLLYGIKSNDLNRVKGYSSRSINDALLDKEEILKQMKEIEQFIKQIETLRAYYAINYKYIHCLPVKQIAPIMGYSTKQVDRIIRIGIDELVKITSIKN